ncbi:MAG TPA: carbohydrate binding domain-containing protein [Armatimonadota bacterium]|nr:carbohydrate binding domain-containing protein [Armatimonadota bacterium]
MLTFNTLWRFSSLFMLTIFLSVSVLGQTTQLFPFVIPGDDVSQNITNVSSLLEKPAGKHGFVMAKDGHLYTGGQRIRFWGTNLVSGACFPPHDKAEILASRFAKLGYNCVRLHMMDYELSPNGLFSTDRVTIDPQQLDKLDYFISRMKAHGIYTDMNLHVGRWYPNMVRWNSPPYGFKGVDLFHQPLIDTQKEYARSLLTHINPYTKKAYCAEPAIAFVEVNNEDGLIEQWWKGKFATLPTDGPSKVVTQDFQQRWNAWLRQKYQTTEALRLAWNSGANILGDVITKNGDFSHGLDGWRLEAVAPAVATMQHVAEIGPDGGSAACIDITTADPTEWHLQLHQTGLTFKNDQSYTITFWAKANAQRQLTVYCGQDHAPWRTFWSAAIKLTQQWQKFSFVATMSDNDTNGRLSFSNFGKTTGTIWIANASIRQGGQAPGLLENEELGTVNIIPRSQYWNRSIQVRQDWMRFLWDCEDAFWSGMYHYLKDDLRVQNLLIGTQINFSPLPMQAHYDVIDGHSYWDHPANASDEYWLSQTNWVMQNQPMSNSHGWTTVSELASYRLSGKPYIVTEYNHPAPNVYASEAYPTLAMYASLQDWDGIFSFAHSSRSYEKYADYWNLDCMWTWFENECHSTKLVTMPAVSAMFLRGDIAPAKASCTVPLSTQQIQQKTISVGPAPATDEFGISNLVALQHRLGIQLDDTVTQQPAAKPSPQFPIVSDTGQLQWDDTPGKATITANTPRTKIIIGQTDERTIDLNGVSVTPGKTQMHWSTITLTVMQGNDFSSKGRILLTATGKIENTGMLWNTTQTSIGDKWGTSPVLVEGIPATVVLPVKPQQILVFPLDERGQRKATPVPISEADGKAKFAIGPEYRTLWYEIVIK